MVYLLDMIESGLVPLFVCNKFKSCRFNFVRDSMIRKNMWVLRLH